MGGGGAESQGLRPAPRLRSVSSGQVGSILEPQFLLENGNHHKRFFRVSVHFENYKIDAVKAPGKL